ncbi:fibrobacter succinogenes major paralogous domain-containing protein, partial [Bacteroidales bacterium OttesenSCG-928-A14]|nr:fibrobacter succinogenes major paralogous domain-containing protein [Bacteroidales bacterium OttesenSCG-928-A14]
ICQINSQAELDMVFNSWKYQFDIVEDGCGVETPDLSSYTINYEKCTDNLVEITYSIADGCTQASATRIFYTMRDTIAPIVVGSIDPDTICANEVLPPSMIDVSELVAIGVTVSDNCSSSDQLSLSSYDVADDPQQVSYYTRYYVVTDLCGNKDSIQQRIRVTPPVFEIYPEPYCANEPGGSIVLIESQAGVMYQLMQGNASVEAPKSGTGGELNWYPVTEGDEYYINIYYFNSPSCSRNSDTVSVISRALPQVGLLRDTASVLMGSTVTIPVTHSGDTDLQVFYSLRQNTVVIQSGTFDIPINSPSPYSWAFTAPDVAGRYEVSLDSAVNSYGCKAALDTIFKLTVTDCQSDDFHIVCPNDTTLTIPYGFCEYDFGFIGYPTISDMPSDNLDTIICRRPEGLAYNRGVHEVVWIAVDVCGRIDSCTQMVIVNFAPCGNDTVYYFADGEIRDSVSYLEAVDYEQNRYASVRIGCDCWTARNLVSTKYADGTDVPEHHIYYADMYPDTSANLDQYGRLYDWSAASREGVTAQGICPDGWFLPAVEHYNRLIPYGSDALRKPDSWLYDNTATNSTGFSALPAGFYNDFSRSYYYLLGDAYFWTSERLSEGVGQAAHIRYLCPVLEIIDFKAKHGASVRCVKR